MGQDMEMGPLEAQERAIEAALASYREVIASDRGRLFFVAGESGSGRTTTLRRLGGRLAYEEPPALVVGGDLAGSSFRAWAGQMAEQRQLVHSLEIAARLKEPITQAAEVAAPAMAALINPYLGLLAALVSVASVATTLRARLKRGQLAGLEQTELPELLLELLRRESIKRPVVLLLANADQASELWLTAFLDTLARQLPVDLPALVVVSLVGKDQPGPHEEAEPTLLRIGRREVQDRKLAAWAYLPPLTADEVDQCLGPIEPRLLEDIVGITGGNLALISQLWGAWQREGLLQRPNDRAAWGLRPGLEQRAAWELRHPVEARLRALTLNDGAAFDRLWQVLRLGALEGRQFSADAVAAALDPPLDRDRVIDELDERLASDGAQSRALLREAGFANATNVARYEFVSDLHWRLMRRYIADEELAGLSRRLADSLIAVYTPHEVHVSRVVAQLYAQAGQAGLAGKYSQIADFLATADAMRIRARALIGMPTDGWDRWQFIDAARTANALGVRLRDHAEFTAAQPLVEWALAIQEEVLGGEHPDTAESLNNLARVLWGQGEVDRARPLLERSLAINEKVLGREDPLTATSLNDLAMLYWEQGEVDRARPLIERAFAIRKKAGGLEDALTAESLNNMATVVGSQEGPDVAGPLHAQALAIFEKVLGPRSIVTSNALNNLGVLLMSKGELDTARPLLERALVIRETMLAPEHPDIAHSLNDLAILHGLQGELDTARPLLERAIAIREKTLGPEHPDTVSSRNDLAMLIAARAQMG